MPWNLLIIPLVAGYYFLTRSNYSKFRQQRLDRQRLVFDSVIYGMALLFVAFAVTTILTLAYPDRIEKFRWFLPLGADYFGTSCLSLVFAFILAQGGNKYIWKDRDSQLQQAIRRVGNEMELMLLSSFVEKKLLLFTLENGKFYIAWAKELPIPNVANYVRIIPAFSGYRTESQELEFTTQYLSVYAQYIKEGQAQSIDDLDIDLTIAVSKIVSLSNFDIDMYERFNQMNRNESAPNMNE
jgi:hypothetical protein